MPSLRRSLHIPSSCFLHFSLMEHPAGEAVSAAKPDTSKADKNDDNATAARLLPNAEDPQGASRSAAQPADSSCSGAHPGWTAPGKDPYGQEDPVDLTAERRNLQYQQQAQRLMHRSWVAARHAARDDPGSPSSNSSLDSPFPSSGSPPTPLGVPMPYEEPEPPSQPDLPKTETQMESAEESPAKAKASRPVHQDLTEALEEARAPKAKFPPPSLSKHPPKAREQDHEGRPVIPDSSWTAHHPGWDRVQ